MRASFLSLGFACVASASALNLTTTTTLVSASDMKLGAVVSCGAAGDLASDVSASLTPEAPCAGDDMTLTLDFNLASAVDSGTSTGTGSYSGIPLPTTTNPLCKAEEGSFDWAGKFIVIFILLDHGTC